MSNRELVRTSAKDHILTITLDRPEARNALNSDMVEGLRAAFRRLDDDDDMRVAILQAEGPIFCAGADLKEALASRDNSKAWASSAANEAPHPRGRVAFLEFIRKPWIACVEGQCLAGGLEVALRADMIVSSTGSQFGLPEARRGLLAIGGGLFRLPRKIPYNLAMEMLLTGAPQSAQAMAAAGLVNRLSPPGEVRAAACELALQIASNSPMAVQITKEVAAAAFAEQLTDEEGFARHQEPFKRLQASEDFIEGLRAFAEKRPAIWKGA